MNIDFSRQLVALNGVPLVFEVNEKGEPTEMGTLQNLTLRALMAPRPDGQTANGMEALQLFDLALRIKNNPQCDVSAEELSTIKQRISETFNTALLVGQAWKMLEE